MAIQKTLTPESEDKDVGIPVADRKTSRRFESYKKSFGHLGGKRTRTIFPIGEADGVAGEEPQGSAEQGEVSTAVDSNYWKGADKHGQRTMILSHSPRTNEAKLGGNGLLVSDEHCFTVDSKPHRVAEKVENLIKIGNVAESGHDSIWGRVYDPKGLAMNLNSGGGGVGAKTGLYAVPPQRVPLKYLSRNQRKVEGDYSFTVDGVNTGGIAIANTVDRDGYLRSGARPRDGNGRPQLLPIGYRRIRRLTPVECERLQNFPDNFSAKGIDRNGKEVAISDTQRYRALGNAVTTSVVTFIGKRLLETLAPSG